MLIIHLMPYSFHAADGKLYFFPSTDFPLITLKRNSSRGTNFTKTSVIHDAVLMLVSDHLLVQRWSNSKANIQLDYSIALMDARLIATSHTCPMTVNEDESSTTKRKADAEKYKKHSIIPNEKVQWGELDNDVIQKILTWLPVASLFRFLSVCKGWNFLFWSPGFHTLCREVPRKPWFYMLCAKSPAGVVYDTEALVWRHIDLPAPTRGLGGATRRYQIPVAASGGLVCFDSSITELTVCNLLTGSTRPLPVLKQGVPVLAIAMRVIGSSYQIVIAVGRAPSYGINVFTSMENIAGRKCL